MWAWDFIHDRTAGGGALKWLNIVDEFTRGCLALKVGRSIKAEVSTLHVEPGAPWENGCAEAFQSRLRDELLDVEEFRDVREATALAHQWRRH